MVLINFLFGLKADHQFLHTKPLRILNTLPRNPPDCDCDRPAVRWDESRTDAPRRRRGSRCSGAKTSSLAPQLDSRPPSLLPYQRRIVPKVSIFPPDSSDTMTWTDDDAALNDHFHLLFRSMLDANARSRATAFWRRETSLATIDADRTCSVCQNPSSEASVSYSVLPVKFGIFCHVTDEQNRI